MKKTIIIVHVNSNYRDIADVFFALFDRFWNDCPYEVIVSYQGNMFKNYGKTVYVADCTSSIANNIYDIMIRYKADFCISFLGDAFFSKKINTTYIQSIIEEMNRKSIEYVRLYNSNKGKDEFSRISKNEVYGVSFIAFICSLSFAEKEFVGNTDYDFEMKYLLPVFDNVCGGDWQHMYALPNSEFGIIHGVEKGIWNRRAYKEIVGLLGDQNIGSRKVESRIRFIFEMIRWKFRDNRILQKIYRKIKEG